MKITNKLAVTLFTIAFGISSLAFVAYDAMSWNIDKTHSSVNFEIRHFFSPVPGAFEEYEADVNFDPNNLEESSIDVTIQVASINTKNDRRDGHLESADFFNAEKYPTMTFSSSDIEAKGGNEFVAHGKLTIKDVTTDFDLPFTLLGVQDHPMRENTKVAGITSEFQLNRNDYGVGTGDWVSDAVVGNEVDVKLNLELHSGE